MTDRESRPGIELLTQRQMEVLIGVAQFKSSKQIARELGISPHTVDQRIRVIINKLGIESRAQAARALLETCDNVETCHRAVCQKIADQTPAIIVESLSTDERLSSGDCNPAVGKQDQQLKEAQANYFAGAPQAPTDLSWASVLLTADRGIDLTVWGRTLCIIVTMLLALLVVGALIALAEGLSRLV